MSSEEMDAFRWFPGAQALTKARILVPRPRNEEVLVKVLAAGMCHSDLMYYDSSFDTSSLKPFTMGHEGAGDIIELGSSVSTAFPLLRLNQYVAINSRNPCFSSDCPACAIGGDNMCTRNLPLGLGIDGAYAPYMTVPARCVVPIDGTKEEIPPAIAAVATDAVLTSYHALKDLKAGGTVLIIGIGGLGVNAVQIAKNIKGAEMVIASDTRDSSLQLALDIGADHAVKPEDLDSFISSNNISIDTACDFVGIPTTFKSALGAVRPRGTILIIGMAAPSVELPLVAAANKDLTVKLSMWGTMQELPLVLEAVKHRKVTPVVESRPLSQALEAFEDLRNARLKGRVALTVP